MSTPTLDRDQTLAQLRERTLIAVIRGDSAEQAVATCHALTAGGVTVHEIAMTTPDALDAIREVSVDLGDRCMVGVGTVLNAPTAIAAMDAGALFVFAPNINLEVIETVSEAGRVIVPGGLTPTEIAFAWEAGADAVKLFPANHFGPRYIKDIHGPMPDVPLIPTGGVDLDTVADWLNAGAVALGVGSSLIRRDLIRAGAWDDLTELARQFVDAVALARANTAQNPA